MGRFRMLVCCTALALMAGASQAGVMNPVPGDPITIESGKLSGTLLDSGIRAPGYCSHYSRCKCHTDSG